MERKVIVLGKNFSTPLGVIRSLAKAGYKVNLLYVANKEGDSKIVASSKYVAKTVEVIGRNDETVIESLIDSFSSSESKAVLFPTDDYTDLLIDKYRDTLQEFFLSQYIIGGTIAERMDKSYQCALARECGLRTAKDWVISLNMDKIVIPDDMIYPCFVKPLISAMGGKSELECCENAVALLKKLYKMQKRMRERSVLVQEFLDIQREYTIGGVCNGLDVFIPAIIQKENIAQHFRGITLCGKMVGNEVIGADLPYIVEFLKRINYVGMFDLEVMQTDRGLYFGELNLRCGGPSYSYFVSGINLPDMAVQAICGETYSAEGCSLNLNKRFLNEKVTWEDYAYLFMTKKELKRLYAESDFTLLSDETDPEPQHQFDKIYKQHYQKIHRQNLLKKGIKTILGRTRT